MLILLVFWLIKPKMSKKNVICVRLIIIGKRTGERTWAPG